MRTVKTQIVFPEELLKELDRSIQRRERSDFVVQAVEEKLQRIKLKQVLEKTAGIWKDHPEMKTDGQVRKYLKRLRGADTGRALRIRRAWNG